ncbi:MAG TPA: hypothetical protein DD733_08920 [Clostridiales bacterium]|nr:hypothetical protein [Clostridiales bacterium]
MKKENLLILELCKFIDPDNEKIKNLLQINLNYPFVLGQLMFNRMGAVAYYTLLKCGLLGFVNREFRNSLKSAYEVGQEKTDSFLTAVDMVNNMLDKVDFPYAMLKGVKLASVYPKGLRTSNDIDILSVQKNIPSLCGLLKENGFSQGYIRNGMLVPASRVDIVNSMMNRGETVPFIKKVDLPKMEYLEIDLNFSLDYKPAENPGIISELLKSVQICADSAAVVLSPEDFIIHLCLHLYKEASVMAWVEMSRDLSLYKFCDIYLLVYKWMNEEFFKRLKRRINELNFGKECFYAFVYTKKLFNIKNRCLDRLISDIKPKNTAFLKEIIQPEENKVYRHKKSLTDWIFINNRRSYLYEVKNETA